MMLIVTLVAVGPAMTSAATAVTADDNEGDRNPQQSAASLPPPSPPMQPSPSPPRMRDDDDADTTSTAAAADRRFGDCDYFEYLVPNKSYDIYSPGYANDTVYDANTNCRWTAEAPPDHSILLDCGNVYMPKSANCVADRLEISGAGHPDLSDAKRFCGVGSFVSESNANKLVIALRSLRNSNGGYFRCSMSTVRMPAGTTQYCECGRRRQNRIVGGVETLVNEFPEMAGLIQAPTVAVFCGATIISRFYAVTAAHCLTARPIDELGLLVGDHDYRTFNDTRFAALYRIGSTTIHPLYADNTNLNDLALVRTSSAIAFNEGVGAVCLPFKYALYGTTFENRSVIATGWGTQEFGGPLSPTLQKVSLNVIGNRECADAFPGMVTAAQLCTYRRDMDTCQSDSGGPLFYTDLYNGFLYLVGTVSYGLGCASARPSVNTRITSYLTWIQANTVGTVYCYK